MTALGVSKSLFATQPSGDQSQSSGTSSLFGGIKPQGGSLFAKIFQSH